ncbi:C45 family autoproteolytic acyltransferase/hydolase [Agrobacterium tumefaciens]|uniref:C45 family autoproteolytic acyltransferase/hydolase n=1 Tax=Agrobacterium tumefaciens TaxID=358 RepID=UPI000975ADD7|nr:acyl-CoA--6-aminopenicillanic acid acyltransferase [Agrobacterium tumefaciens]
MNSITPFPFFEIHGSPAERGRMHGEQARERVQLSASFYREQMARLGFGRDEVADLVAGFPARLRDWAPDLIEEMEGIASGANIDFTSIFLINARTELLQLARRQKRAGKTEVDGCTGVVVLPEASRTGSIIHAQNWDWRAECVDTSVVIRVLSDNGPDILMFTEAGGLMRSGFNSAGIALTANYLESDRDYRELGIPLPFIRRRALESPHFAMALRTIAITEKSGSNNVIISSVEGFAIDLECAPDEAFPIFPQDDLIVHANHWQSPVALSKLKETGFATVPDSFYRDVRVRKHLKSVKGGIDADDVKAALSDKFGSPYAVCRPTIPNENGNLSATVAMLVCQPVAGIMEIAPLPAINTTFTRYELKMDDTISKAEAA